MKLTDDELSYHKFLQHKMEQAQLILNVWGEYLGQKYQAPPSARIDAEGNIITPPTEAPE